MPRLLPLFPLTLLAATAASAAPPAPLPAKLRVGYLGQDAACAAPGGSTPASLARYAALLARRFAMPVELCGFAEAGTAARAFAQGSVDFAPLTPAAWPAAQGKARPILTLRAPGALPRTPILAIAKASSRPLDPPAIAGKRVAVLRRGALAHDAARAALATHGGGAILKAETPVAGSFGAALAGLGGGRFDVVLVPVDDWAFGCAAARDACKPFHVVWQDRPQPAQAWCLRAGLPDELRYRLIGVHLSLRLEDAQSFAGVAGRPDGAFEPAEATALASSNTGAAPTAAARR